MYKTKRELDIHVEDVFSKLRGKHEKSMRCFTIAKQYASIKEFTAALRYMEKYLTTNPANTADALKLMGDFYQETDAHDKALQYYKSSYVAGKSRETLNRICDLLEAGHGSKEDQGVGRQKWFVELQRTSTSATPSVSQSQPLPYHHGSSSANYINTNSPSSRNNGPPKTAYSNTHITPNISHSTPKSISQPLPVNGVGSHDLSSSFSTSPKLHSSPERAETQIRNLERRYDDILAKILSAVQRVEDEVKDLTGKVDNISLIQEELAKSRTDSGSGNVTKSNGTGKQRQHKNISQVSQPQPMPQPFSPNPAFGYGVPFPSPYMHPYFMPDPALSYAANPMLAAAALYGNQLFANPLPAAGVPRNEALSRTSTAPLNPNETSLLADLLSKNQFIPQAAAATSTPPAEPIYPQSQLQAQMAFSANLTDKLWQQPQLVPTSVALGPIFPNNVEVTSGNILKTPESNKNDTLTSTPVFETPKSASAVPAAKKDVVGKNLFPENVVVSNTEKVPTVSSAPFNSNMLSVTIPPEHRNAGTGNNNTTPSTNIVGAFNNPNSANETKNVSKIHNFQISAPVFKPQQPIFDDQKQDEALNPFSSISLTAPSFGDLAKSAASTGFIGFQNSNAFGGAGIPVFKNVIASQSAAGESVVRQDRVDGEEVTDDFVPTAEFQPVIPLPPLVEVKKGNENENKLFEHRAKIYRFVKETKEWKERGVGNIMILQNKDNPRKIRVVMWRERVFKLACNHWVTKDLVIENHQGSPKVLKWTVMDFAEGENDPKSEIFTCRFGQEDKCAEFKATMEKMIAFLATQTDSSPVKPSNENTVEESPKPFADLFKKPPGSWNCKSCYISNAEKDTACVACHTLKDGTAQKSLQEMFKPPEGSWNCDMCYTNNKRYSTSCVACQTPKPGCLAETAPTIAPAPMTFTFGFGAVNNAKSASDETLPNPQKDPIQNITKSIEKPPATNLNVPKCTPVTESQLRDLLTPNTSPQREKEDTEPKSTTSETQFRFGNDTVNTTGFVFKAPEKKTEDSKSLSETVNPFSSISLSGPSFGDLAKNATGFTGFQNTNSFSGTGAPVFGFLGGSPAVCGDSGAKVDEEEVVEDFVPDAEFKPVIPLPPLVVVKKGNENENTLFEHRAKIYRFVKETKEWKERGVGNIMILQNKDNPRKIRVVMWRERVFKLACNHWVTKDLVIENHQGSSKVLKWTVMDFAEGENDPKSEIFTCRFGQEDKCAEFKATMEKMIVFLATQPDSSPVKPSNENTVEESPKPFADLFKKPPGSWNCKSCYISNAEKDTACVACHTPKDGTGTQSGDPKTEISLSEQFKKPEGSWNCDVCYVNNKEDAAICVACNTENPGRTPSTANQSQTPETAQAPTTFGFSFGLPKLTSTQKDPAPSTIFNASTPNGTMAPAQPAINTTGFVFKAPETKTEDSKSLSETVNPFSSISLSGPSFGDLAKNATGFTGFQVSNSFSGTGTPVFGFLGGSPTVGGVSGAKVDEEEVVEDFVPDAEFKPVIPLPPLVEVKKGNENENTLFEHRAKIYRFVKETKEWKERGVGNITILQNKDNPRKIRVVMWRERVFKLACNHWITKDLVIENHQGSSKVLKWTAMDFAEGENDPKSEIFTCRFGQEDKCAEFKATLERMIAYLGSEPASPEKPSNDSSVDESPKPFAEIFKKTEGSWNCKSCFVSNSETDTTCVSCQALKDSLTTQDEEQPQKSLSELFKQPEGNWNCEICYVNNGKHFTKCVSCETPKPGSSSDTLTSVTDVPTTEEPAENCCPGCRGCDPESFDFEELDKRILPLLPKESIRKITNT